MTFEKVTEESSRYHDLEKMSIREILTGINREDREVPDAVEKAIPQIERLAAGIKDKMLAGGARVFIVVGTSGGWGGLWCTWDPPTSGLAFYQWHQGVTGGESG